LTASLLQAEAGDRLALLERMDRALRHLSELIDNSLVEARLQGRPVLQYETLDLTALVELAVEEVRGSADQKDVQIVRQLAATELRGDRRLLLSAVTNLLSNAVKFSRDGGRVTVRTRADGEQLVLEIEDACGGLPEGDPAKLFQPFTQLGEDRSGFGLGLMIVKQAIEAHGGSIEVINRPGDGCCFSIRLSRAEA
jgi:signal transduction histidine kinase